MHALFLHQTISKKQLQEKSSCSFSINIILLKNHVKINKLKVLSPIINLSMDLSPPDCPEVPKDFHKNLRTRFYQQMTQQNLPDLQKSICLFKGIQPVPKNHEDTFHVVEQDSTFWYLFGVKEESCYATIDCSNGKTTLFIPRYEEAYKMWMYVKPQEKFKQDYLVEDVKFVDELEEQLKIAAPETIYIWSGNDSDSKLDVKEPEDNYLRHGKQVNREFLWTFISNLRVIKTEEQIELMRYVCRVATEAHITAMKSAKAGLKQIQLHAVFHYQHTVHTGCHHIGFDSICSSGQDCATLHYIENDKIIESGQMLLHDMGGKWHGYCADQAITFPVDGKFTQKQKAIYNAVYQAQKKVLETMRPGLNWADMHLLAQRVILEHLIEIGIVNKFPMEELQEQRIGAVFFPHGLGHFLGLRVHDVGGYTAGPPRSDKAGLRSLRTRRDLEQNMIVTVEPGCYFIDFIIKEALNNPEKAKYLNADKIEEYRCVGGVRLEDDVVVRKDGPEMLSFLPRRWEQVQKVLAE